MKILITLLLSTVCLITLAQKSSKQSLSESMHDDGKTLKVDITGDANGRELNYHRKFNIKGMSNADKDALTKRIADSLGIQSSHRSANTPVTDKSYAIHTVPTPPTAPNAPDAPARVEMIKRSISSSINDDGETMYIKFKGTYNDKPVKFERIFDVKGMSSKEKDTLLKGVTDSLGISNEVRLRTSN